MAIARLYPAPIAGTIAAPPSKSAAHRALVCAALAGGGQVSGVAPSADMRATLLAAAALGAHVRQEGDTVTVLDRRAPAGAVTVDCLESGSTLRFFLPVFAALGIPATFTGQGRLPRRPLGVYGDCLPAHGARLSGADGLPLTVEGRLTGGVYRLPGDVSSQFISGLLFALPLCAADSDIVLTTPLESAAYINLTIAALTRAGVTVSRTPQGWHVPGGQRYRPAAVAVEGDWSQAAFPLAMGALGGRVTVTGLDPASVQGDRAVVGLLRGFGAPVTVEGGCITCEKAPLHGQRIDAAQIPDLVPILAVLGALAQGETQIENAGRLRLKESDRLAAMADCLTQLGARVVEGPEALRLTGTPMLTGGRVPGYNDHRIVMSLAAACTACRGPLEITDADSVRKSWPDFFAAYRALGGIANVLDDR